MAKRYRDAITGEFMKKEEAEKRTDSTVAETVKKRKGTKKPKKPVVQPDEVAEPIVVEENLPTHATEPEVGEEVESENIPDSGASTAVDTQRKAFQMRMDVIYKGDIFIRGKNEDKVPQEVKDYLKWEE